MSAFEDINRFSLVWPENSGGMINKLSESSITDLDIDELVNNISMHIRFNKYIKSILLQMCEDVDVINYRLDVLEDLLRYPEIVDTFIEILPVLSDLSNTKNFGYVEESPLMTTVHRVGELQIYTDCINSIFRVLHKYKNDIKSDALCHFRNILEEINEDEQFKALNENLPKFRSGFERLSSITIGINLDDNLKPVEATMLSINDYKFIEDNFIGRLFGNKRKNSNSGISELRSIVPKYITDMNGNIKLDSISDALQITYFKDLNKILKQIIEPVSATISKYSKASSEFLVSLESELGFYLSAVKFIKKFEKCNLNMCRPEVIQKEKRTFVAENNYNIGLALRKMANKPEENICEKIIGNDVTFNDNGRIFILTGPNQGGKTTYIEAIGVTQIIFQAGLFVPASRAILSPTDNVFTHYQIDEKPETNAGRLGEEAGRLADLFDNATKYSMVLLNEALASTSPGESLYMSEDIVRGLRLLGCRAIFATHLHDLALRTDIINEEVDGDSRVISMVAGVEKENDSPSGKTRRTYKVIPSPPQGMSYAKDIASRYKISFEHIAACINNKNLK